MILQIEERSETVRFDPTKPVFNGSQYGGYYAWIDPASKSIYNWGSTMPH